MIEIPRQINFLKMAGIDAPAKKPDKKYPSFNLRMIAATIDSFLAMVIFDPIFDLLMHDKPFDVQAFQMDIARTADALQRFQLLMQGLHDSGMIQNMLVQTLGLLLATGICWRFWAATPGKLLLRMRVVDALTGQPIRTSQIIKRLLGYMLSALPLGLGFFWISFDKHRQGWHDKFAGTVVIFKPKIPAAHPSVPPAPSESA